MGCRRKQCQHGGTHREYQQPVQVGGKRGTEARTDQSLCQFSVCLNNSKNKYTISKLTTVNKWPLCQKLITTRDCVTQCLIYSSGCQNGVWGPPGVMEWLQESPQQNEESFNFSLI